eukprot:CAMPEP_0116157436 /NCGR_PEP_ID=MMETSP0329-20121206/23343_1 /TAXON_ID=697910 /ORGANISM="Pseudo-nitzschia arenysensis, Strain B593" /LENGTH=1206 /DNA_ID=CAMNT_0003654543 /DNA_START=341 /DNA_END=3962 /DNA_ORIENTATION=-
MATGDKSSSPHTHLNHVELGTNPTGEGKNSEFTFSNGTEGTKEDGSVMTNTTTGTTHATLSQTTTPPVHLPASEATTSSPDLQTNTTSENKVSHVSNQPSASTPPPRPTTRPPVMEVEMQRSKEADTENFTTPAHPKVSGGSSRIRAASIDEASHLQELLSSPEGNSQIVERSPGERYVRFSEKLGSGASKDVYRAYDTEEGIEVAWNVVHLAGVPKNERNRIVNEVRLLERLHHQNIISFHGSWINREQQQVNFVTEILSFFHQQGASHPMEDAKRWAVQILKGLEYLHAQDPPVIHRDLKCENIFINGTSGDLRIGDLGLSTVHRNNGKALSVLGTPEFMAPDMYEEGSYDEKVDIYAFGMCLLEIFTKEIPYKECTNPAQIYKKVTRGAPPDSLARLKSDHARQFIELCLGYRNDDGKYVRPSAKELLDHPFLEKRSVDDEEVEVDPPLQEQTIKETGTRSAERLSSDSRGTNANTSNSASTTHSQNLGSPSKEVPPAIRHSNLHQDSLDEDESDRFEEMPDSEVNNMKKVKVMMGRGEELKEDDDIVEDVNHVTKRNSVDINTSIEVASFSSAQNVLNNDTNGKKLHYLVAAAVIQENEQTNTDQMPYPDDILNLVITLPVEGQTQNVQFDFDLVEDDPIQVAKEMVAELGIPEDAVLEISETVSGLARDARTKKHKFSSAKAQQNPGHIRNNSLMTTRSSATAESQVGQTAVAQPQTQQRLSQGIMQATNQQPPMQQPMPQQSLPHGQQLIDNNQMASQMQHLQPPRGSIQSGDSEPHRQAQIPYVQAGMEMSTQIQAPKQSQMNGEYHHQGHVSSETKQPLAPYGQAPVPPPAPSMSMPGSGSQMPQQRPPQPSHGTQQPPSHVAPPGDSAQQTMATSLPPMPNQQIHGSSASLGQAYSPHQQLQPSMQRAHSFTQPQQQQPQLVQPPVQQIPNIPPQQHMPNVVQQQPPIQLQMNHQSSLPPQQQQLQQAVTTQQHQIHQGRPHQIQQAPMAQQHPVRAQNQQQEYQVAPNQLPAHGQRISTGANSMSLPMTQDIPVAQQNGPHLRINEGIVSSATDPSQATTIPSRTTSLEKEQKDERQGESMGALEGLSIDASGEDEPTDEVCAEELRKLDEDFQNNLKRAKKVFVNRMDNLQRTQGQREAQHQKTLEQHQKDRTAFEKRLQQEEIEQNRRIELLQAEWDRRREEVRSKDKSPNPQS